MANAISSVTPLEVVGSFGNVVTVDILMDGTALPLTVTVPRIGAVQALLAATMISSAGAITASNHTITFDGASLTITAGAVTSGSTLRLLLRARGGF